jgi:hypothetical protein
MARKPFTISLEDSTIKAIKIRAAQESTDSSKIIEKLLLEYLKTPMPKE